jgi:hypothetical protein
MSIDYLAEQKKLAEFSGDYWKPKAGQYKVKALSEVLESEPFIDEKDNEPKPRCQLRISSDNKEYVYADGVELDKFIVNEDEWSALTFIIKGYAGTGKTTVISTLIKILGTFSYKTQLLAPTGRAAKVMANYSKKKAFTILPLV